MLDHRHAFQRRHNGVRVAEFRVLPVGRDEDLPVARRGKAACVTLAEQLVAQQQPLDPGHGPIGEVGEGLPRPPAGPDGVELDFVGSKHRQNLGFGIWQLILLEWGAHVRNPPFVLVVPTRFGP